MTSLLTIDGVGHQSSRNQQSGPSGLTRRELLKRGAVLGGALAWSTPVVQLIGMNPAMATHVSQLCVCVKLDGCDATSPWSTINPNSPATCIEIPGDCDPSPDLSLFQNGSCTAGADEFCVQQENGDGDLVLYYPEYCTLISLFEKAGQDCIEHEGPFANPLVLSDFITDRCSHLEFCFQC